jgi:DNA polymerase-1
MILAWDGCPVQQLAQNPAYKAQRADAHADRPADWRPRCERLRAVLTHVLPTLHDPEDEADAEIARLVNKDQAAKVLLVSTDKDLFSLLSEHVHVLRPGRDQQLYTAQDFIREFGFPPAGFPLYRALTGDRSDNLRGLPYFLTKTAARLAAEFGNVDALYAALGRQPAPDGLSQLRDSERQKLLSGEETVRSNARLLDLRAVQGPPHLTLPDGDAGPLQALLNELELDGLVSATGWGPEQELTLKPDDEADRAGESSPQPQRLTVPPVWAERLEQSKRHRQQPAEPARIIPRSPAYYAGQLTVVADALAAHNLVELARQRPLVCIGIDCEFRHARPAVWMKTYAGKDLYWHDPHSYVPLLLAVVLVEKAADGGVQLNRFVVDCRRPETVAPLADLFRIPVCFVGHRLEAELICLWRLGLPTPNEVWDTWVAEKALLLGLSHPRYKKARPADDLEEAEAKEAAEEEKELKCSLPATCARRGVLFPFAADKERLQQSFLDHPDGAPFTEEQREYNAADAEAAVRVYPAQVQAAAERGCLGHLVEIEMPWTVTNARMVWDGVRLDGEQCGKLLAACDRHQQRLGQELGELGLANVDSYSQVKDFFEAAGLLHAFRTGDGHSFDDDHLEAAAGLHPVVSKIRLLRKIGRMRSGKALTGELFGADGRLHPDHRQLGAESSRNTMRWPNIGGIGRALRPLVVPEAGHAIGEVDLSQIEVGIAAAVFNDPDLIQMFNGRDVYAAMAKRYYAAELPPEAQAMPDKQFKKKYPDLRDRMKVFTLAVIYNITPFGLALRYNISVERAAEERARFLAMFPALARALHEASAHGAIRGYAYLCSGLRRWRARTGFAWQWEMNWMINTPVQGSAAVVFKVAGNRLYRRFQHYRTRMILPMHDAFIFEAPKEHLQTVAAITAEVLKSTVQEYFPMLDPQVEENIDHPECWNKDGHADSLARWIVDPASAF